MARKLVTTMAMSLDGCIADESGDFGWIAGDGGSSLDTGEKWDFARFLEQVDIVVMGRRSYDQDLHQDLAGKQIWVATSREGADHGNVRFIRGDIVQAVLAEQQKQGRSIYLFGGGILLEPFIREDRIDEYIIGIVPIILGSGRRLFPGQGMAIPLKLNTYSLEEGICILHYARRNADS